MVVRSLLLCAAVSVASATLCYDTGSSEYIVQHGKGCGRGRDYTLPSDAGTYKGLKVVETASSALCQKLCHMNENCKGFEWQTYDEATGQPLVTPKCSFRTDTDTMVDAEHSTCFRKSLGGAYKFCAREGGTCSCSTEARFGKDGAWVHVPISGSNTIACTAEQFNVKTTEEGRECQCASHDGLELLLDAANYVSGDEWLDESGNGHNAYLAFPYEKDQDTAPEFVPGFRAPAHFTFDGKNDYIALKDMHFSTEKHLSAFSISILFRTTWTHSSVNSNWALIDFDRSEFFNVFVRATDGFIGFSSHGKDGTNDMRGSTVVNDGGWHWVTVTYSMAQQQKSIYVDGVLDSVKTGVHETGVGSSKTRYGMVGEGSESSTQFGSGNGIYFHGDISRIEIYTSILDPSTLTKGTSSGVPIGDKSTCDTIPGGKCVWASDKQSDTYYFAHADEEGDSVRYITGTDPTVLFPHAAFTDMPPQTTTVRVVLEEGCMKEDKLEAGWLEAGVTSSYDSCSLTLQGQADVTKWQKMVRSIVFSTGSEDFHERRISWNFGDQIYSSETGHYYQFLHHAGVTWHEAKDLCEKTPLLGQPGYLVTVTSAIENNVVKTRLHGEGWIGLSDAETEGEWRWVTGPEGLEDSGKGRIVGYGTRDFKPHHGEFSQWAGGEPNDYGDNEDYGHYLASGDWNDYPEDKNKIQGYVCEWGGLGGAPVADPYHGTVMVRLEGCIVKPCNHDKKNYCLREKGCSWSTGSATCYPTCPDNYFSELCNVYCHPKETCSGKGKCNNDGKCTCDKEWGGPTCSWPRHQCKAWGDPHYTSFDEERFDFHGVPQSTNLGNPVGRFVVYERGSYKIIAQHYRCSGTDKRPIGCMKQIRFVAGAWSMEINVDFGQSPSEYGIIHVSNGTSSYNVDAVAMKKSDGIPMLIGDVALVKVYPSKKRVTYTFELPNENDIHTRVKLAQDNSWRAPYMNIYVDHFGSTHGVSGLCTGSCDSSVTTTGWGKDCTEPFADQFDCQGPDCNFGTVIRDADIKFCQGLPMGQGGCTVDSLGCDNNMVALDWARSCCDKFKSCGGEDQYKQCVVENCNMGWVGEEKYSKCADAFQGVLLESRECEREICTQGKNRGGPDCNECLPDYYGPDCDKYCNNEITCNGHGTCNGQGKCWCEKGFWSKDVKNGRYCLHVCEAQSSKVKCDARGKTCRWSTAESRCMKACPKGYFGLNCKTACDPKTTCSNHGSCDKDGKCVCKVGWGGEDCGMGKYTCSAWGDPHYTSFEGKRFDFFGPGYEMVGGQKKDIEYELYGKGSLHVQARHWKCNSRATCMGKLSIWDERGGTVEMRIDGSLRVNCTEYSSAQVQEMLRFGDWVVLPRNCNGNTSCEEVSPLRLTAAKKTNLGKGKAPSFFFEVSKVKNNMNGETDIEPELKIDLSTRTKAIDVYLTHFGDHPVKEGVVGLCHGKPGSGKPGTGEPGCFTDEPKNCQQGGTPPYGHCRTGPPRCAVVNPPTCWSGVPDSECGFCDTDNKPDPPMTIWRCDDPASKLQVEECCKQRKSCKDGNGDGNGGSAYEQCVWDECALGEDNKCLDNHGAALDFDDQSMEESCACEDPHMAIDYETGLCTACKPGWYPGNGKQCAKFCDAAVTCNNHGSCDGGGYCWCDEGYEGDECLAFNGVPPQSKACADQGDMQSCDGVTGCMWADEILACFRKTGKTTKQCWEYFNEAECGSGGCFWETREKEEWLEGTCVVSRPPREVIPTDCGDNCPQWFTPVKGNVQKLGCLEDECTPPREGDKVFVNVTGFPSNKVFQPSCAAAAEAMLQGKTTEEQQLCQDGWALVIDSSTSCDTFYDQKITSEMPYPTRVYRSYYLNETTRVSPLVSHWDHQDENLHGYKICYVPLRPANADPKLFVPSTVAARSCPGNYEFGQKGECTTCKDGWYGVECNVYCTAQSSCHGHGTCKEIPRSGDVCTCDSGWVDEVGMAEEEFKYTMECYAATKETKAMPGYEGYVPKEFAVKTAELRPAGEEGGCGAEMEYEECRPPVKGEKVIVNVTGVAPSVSSGCDGEGCKVGSAAVVRKGASCSKPAAGDILMDDIVMEGTKDPEVKVSKPVTLEFDPMTEEYEVCYHAKVSSLPVDVKEHVDTKPATLAKGAPKDGSSGGGSSSSTGAIVGGVAAGVAVLAAAGFAAKKLIAGAGSGGKGADFSQSKLDQLAPQEPGELAEIDEMEELYDREEP
eukprot:TRINITY_DN647_c0_g1_i13.p1 TRINITY_DN647_c0_g1~~TRINITY_DN647_c0_g1_i13.p1  ORF type:complete len:2257 (+),score=636.78 TRINITY_DN647_c0_g1_i13:134-6772(+)